VDTVNIDGLYEHHGLIVEEKRGTVAFMAPCELNQRTPVASPSCERETTGEDALRHAADNMFSPQTMVQGVHRHMGQNVKASLKSKQHPPTENMRQRLLSST
jgi:type IV secretory pathway VirD2 relaxase